MAAGCEGWDFETVLPYFNRLETDLRYGSEPYHGDAGPIPSYRAPMNRWGPVDLALAEIGREPARCTPVSPGRRTTTRPGPWASRPMPSTTGTMCVCPRMAATDLSREKPARGRNTLTIRGDALIDRLHFEGRGKGARVAGVIVRTGNGEGGARLDTHATRADNALIRNGNQCG